MLPTITTPKTTVQKVGLTALWVGSSAVIAYFITLLTSTPGLFGIYAPIINVVLVAIKNLLDSRVPNV